VSVPAARALGAAPVHRAGRTHRGLVAERDGRCPLRRHPCRWSRLPGFPAQERAFQLLLIAGLLAYARHARKARRRTLCGRTAAFVLALMANRRAVVFPFRDCDDCPEMIRLPQLGIAIGKYEVTQAEWRQVMGGNPSSFRDCGADCPVETVSWYDIHTILRSSANVL